MTNSQKILLPAVCILFFSCGVARKNNKAHAIGQDNKTIQQKGRDTLPVSGKIKPYNEVITATALSDDGLFKVHAVANKYFLEISNNLFEKDLLVVNRITEGGASWGYRSSDLGYAGDNIGDCVIHFVKGPDDKIFLKIIYQFGISTDSAQNGLYSSVQKNNLPPIVAVFDIKAFSPDNKGVVIDITDYLNSQNEVFSFGRSNNIIDIRASLGLSALQPDKSYIRKISSFTGNMEIQTIKTYTRSSGLFVTYALNSSVILLPKVPMHTRNYDERVGYFPMKYNDVSAYGVNVRNWITRWKLEPKEEDKDKYLKGILVEPQKPIIFYIDPATPPKWVPYLIQGVNAWQKAFEKAGFKNAIMARAAPSKEEDSTWSLEDARYSAIVYKPSEIQNASGPHVHDPRSGEILETHINWYHNVMQLLHDWYFVQAAATDPKARKMQYDDTLMGQLIKYVCTHEVGHTLGLTHNFGASSTVPVDSLRSRQWLKVNGLTPSIMDYSRFNYVAQPEDSIPEEGILPKIGIYDEWAIEWGYRWYPAFASAQEEKSFMNKWVINKLADKRLYYGNEGLSSDPRNQSEDLGDDAVLASTYGIKNLKQIIPHLKEWATEPDNNYTSLARMYESIFVQFKNYLMHVADMVGGATYTPKTIEQKGLVWDYPDKAKQQSAVQFIQEQIFTTPIWILDKDLFRLTQVGGVYKILYLQKSLVEKLLSHDCLANLLWFQTNTDKNAYTPDMLLTDIESGIFQELQTKRPIDIYRRNLQKTYVTRLIELLKPYKGSSFSDFSFQTSNLMTDIRSIIKGHLEKLTISIIKSQSHYKDQLTQFHLSDLKEEIKSFIANTKEN